MDVEAALCIKESKKRKVTVLTVGDKIGFKISDLGLVAGYKVVLPVLIEKLKTQVFSFIDRKYFHKED